MRRASLALKRAHQYVPDGMDLQIDIDPETRQIVATVVGADGKSQQHVVDPQQVPQLLKGAMDGSEYWKAVYQIGQPRLAEQGMQDQASMQREQYKAAVEEQKNTRESQEEEYRHNRDLSDGLSPGERRDNKSKAFYGDWQQRYAAAPPEQKPQLMQEGLGYTFENTPDRKTPVDSTMLTFDGTANKDTFEEADQQVIRGIAQSIAAKNSALDAGGAMDMAAALVMAPAPQVTSDGRLSVNGFNLVFNPSLLPQLQTLNKKYRPQGTNQ